MLFVVRPLLARLATLHEDHGRLSGPVMATIFVGLILSALATDRIGIHAIFGAFLFGVIMPQRTELTEELFEKLEDFSIIFLLPLFFAFSGLRTDVLSLGTDPELWLYTLLIVAVAVAGKWGGSAVAARVVGMRWRESLCLGVLMNCRGLTELVILNIGLELGVIPPQLFSMLVIMALVTTFMTTPLLSLLMPDEVLEEERALDADDDGVRRVLVHVASMDHAYELVHTALAAIDDVDHRIEILLLRTIHIGDDRILSGAMLDGTSVDRARRSLTPLQQFIEGSGATAVPLALQTSDVGRTVSEVAAERGVEVVVLRSGRPFSPSALHSGTIGRILDRVEADVLVVVDPTGAGTSPPPGGRIVVPYLPSADGAIDVARQIARTHGSTVRLVATHAQQDAATRLAARHAGSSGAIVSTEIGTAEDVATALAGGTGADLVVLPFDGTDSVPAAGRVWSRTPVLVVRPGQGGRGPTDADDDAGSVLAQPEPVP
jgi:hypothetical protein